MILSRANQYAILELKRATRVRANIERAQHQLLTYLIKSEIDTGVLYFWPLEEAPMLVDDSQTDMSGRHFRIIEVFPKLATEKENKESQSNGA